MKIQIIHFTSSPGGIEVLMPQIINNMLEYKFESFVIRPSSGNKVNIYNKLKIPVTYGSKNNIIALIKLFMHASNHRRDIFYAFNIGPFYLLILRIAGIDKVVYSIRGTKYWNNKFQKFIRKYIWRITLSDKCRVIGNSHYASKVFTDYLNLPTNLVTINYNPVANANLYLKPKSEKINSELEIIYAGRLVHGKNLFKWIEIAASIHTAFPNSVFRLYGIGPLLDELVAFSRNLGIDDCVHFEGFSYDIASAFRKADLMIFLSEYESFGNVVVESILCGTPVISSAIPSMKEIFINYPEFILNESSDLTEQIINKVSNIQYLKELTCAAEKEFRVRFSIEQHINKLRDINDSFKK